MDSSNEIGRFSINRVLSGQNRDEMLASSTAGTPVARSLISDSAGTDLDVNSDYWIFGRLILTFSLVAQRILEFLADQMQHPQNLLALS